MTDLAAAVAESRTRQGLDPTVTDPSALAAVATLLDVAEQSPPARDAA